MGFDTVAAGLIAAFAQLVVGLVLAVCTVHVGLSLFGRLTKGIDEWNEVKKGNVAVGLLMLGIVVSMATIVYPGVLRITGAIKPGISFELMLISVLIGLINLILTVVAAVIAIYLAYRTFEKVSGRLDGKKQLLKGNIAVGLILAGVFVCISTVVSAATGGILNAIDPLEIAVLLGL